LNDPKASAEVMFTAMDQDGDGFFTLDDMTRVMGAMM